MQLTPCTPSYATAQFWGVSLLATSLAAPTCRHHLVCHSESGGAPPCLPPPHCYLGVTLNRHQPREGPSPLRRFGTRLGVSPSMAEKFPAWLLPECWTIQSKTISSLFTGEPPLNVFGHLLYASCTQGSPSPVLTSIGALQVWLARIPQSQLGSQQQQQHHH